MIESEAGRDPVDAHFVESRLVDRGVPWPTPLIKATTESTNVDVSAMARDGAPEGTVVVADEQTAGRGRLGRTWDSARGAGLWLSVLVRLERGDHGRLGLLPLVAGVAVAEALGRHGVDAVLKWPNDVVVIDDDPSPRKLAGILCESDGAGAAVIGIGINVSQSVDALPAGGTSLAIEGVDVGRADLLVDVLTALHESVDDLRVSGGATALADYRRRCATLGREVVVTLPTGAQLTGRATDIADDGRLGVDVGGNVTYVAAGDVTHATI